MSEIHTPYDIAIIGAGVAGLSAAYFLSAHARVVVFEQESQIAYHSSSRSAAMFIQGYENATVCRLTNDSESFFVNPPTDLCDVPLLHPRGGLTCAGPGETQGLADHFNHWQPLCPELVEVSVTQAHELAPIVRKEWISAATYDPSWRSIDTHALLMTWQKGYQRNGGEIITNAPIDGLTRHRDVWQINSGTQQWQANVVVNAAGAWANHIAQLAGLDPVPLTPLRRTAMIVPLADTLTHMPLVHTVAEDIYFKPESPGLMVSPADEIPSEPMDAYPLELDVAMTMDRLQKMTTHSAPNLLHQWAGLRTYASDRAPVVGFDPSGDQFFWLAGQGGFGVQTCPALAELSAAAICQQTPLDADIDVVRWRR